MSAQFETQDHAASVLDDASILTARSSCQPKNCDDYVKDIHHHWGRAVQSIIATGCILLAAKEGPHRLQHGTFEAMVRSKLPFSERTAQMLMKIAGHPVLSNPKHVSLLPPSWGTLYELTKLPDNKLLTGIRDGTITPKLERRDAAALHRDRASRTGERTSPNLHEQNAQLKAENQRLREDKGDAFGPNDTVADIVRVIVEQLRRLSNDKIEKVLQEVKRTVKVQRS
ncbi:hypothetical protein [Bradyrhizobium sp. Gha]|uniref:hypothetical protein n=1 Tax=Bradyrhizobium sp. Gha TaxID=1855318 RepID=UPI0008EC0952|nr:hypothetical protein [Bradyrhizobium sp. Gha]SFJ53221.1 hypothetical protein SAMN05216525_12791 [Bradyrhizobium sp. Gha]